jgi:hypothetical protein
MLGITFVSRLEKNAVIVDCYSGGKEHQPSFGRNGPQLVLFNADSSIDHKETWLLLNRILSKTHFSIELLPKNSINALLQTNISTIASKRNQFCYKATGWNFDECRQSMMVVYEQESLDLILEDQDHDLFLPIFCQSLLEIAGFIFENLAQHSSAFNSDYLIFKAWKEHNLANFQDRASTQKI